MMNFCWPLINMHDDNSSFFCLKMIYAVSCQEENSRQKRFQVQEDFPKTVQSWQKTVLVPRHDSHDSSFCGNPKLQWLALQISRCQKNQITGDDGNGIQNEYWVTQQNDYFIAKSQLYALAHCSRELQNLEAHEQNVRELSLSQTHRAYKSTNLMRGGGPVNSPDHI